MFKILCPNCQQELEVQEEWTGMEAECLGCRQKFIIPDPIKHEDSQYTEFKHSAALDAAKNLDYTHYDPLENHGSLDENTQTLVKQHFLFASLAMQTGSYKNAEKEFQNILTIDPNNYLALYGGIAIQMAQTSYQKPTLENVIYDHQKLIHILTGYDNHEFLCAKFKIRFIIDFSKFIVPEYNKTLAQMEENKRESDIRDALNMLNAVSRKIILSNPEAVNNKSQNELLLRYLRELFKIFLYAASQIDIPAIGNDINFLRECRAFCVPIQDRENVANTVCNIDKTINEIEIKTMAYENNMTYDDAKKQKENFASAFDKIKNNIPKKIHWWWLIFGTITIYMFIGSMHDVIFNNSGTFLGALIFCPLFGGFATLFIFLFWVMAVCIIRGFEN